MSLLTGGGIPILRQAVPLLLVLALMPASASHCTTQTTSDTVVDAAGHYVDWDYCLPIDCHLSIWVYEESNGIDGLQRGDEVVDDTCHGMIRPDTIIF